MRSILRLCFCSEEGIVDAVEMFSLDAAARVLNPQHHPAWRVEGRNLKRCVGASEHGILRVQHQIKNDLLQLALIPMDTCEVRIEVRFHANLRGLELMLQQSNGVVQQL